MPFAHESWSSLSNQLQLTNNFTYENLSTVPNSSLRMPKESLWSVNHNNIIPGELFLYLIQTEECFPEHLNRNDVIGSASTCQCDVVILSFKKRCTITPPVHVKYVFNSSTSWAEGRNVLFEIATRRTKNYLYYIFMDDDIILKEKVTTTNGKIINNWRRFENFLKQVQPAIGAVDADNNIRLEDTYRGRRQRQCVWKEKTDYLPAPRYDPAFNAFHHKAVKYLLPYPSQFDNLSWYYAELQVEIKCEVIFAGQSVLHTKLIAKNKQHRPYRKVMPQLKDFDYLVDSVRQGLPERYRNSSLLQEWKRDGLTHGEKSSTVCLSPPKPCTPIEPFAYLDRLIAGA